MGDVCDAAERAAASSQSPLLLKRSPHLTSLIRLTSRQSGPNRHPNETHQISTPQTLSSPPVGHSTRVKAHRTCSAIRGRANANNRAHISISPSETRSIPPSPSPCFIPLAQTHRPTKQNTLNQSCRHLLLNSSAHLCSDGLKEQPRPPRTATSISESRMRLARYDPADLCLDSLDYELSEFDPVIQTTR
jgi:hypothetical protein